MLIRMFITNEPHPQAPVSTKALSRQASVWGRRVQLLPQDTTSFWKIVKVIVRVWSSGGSDVDQNIFSWSRGKDLLGTMAGVICIKNRQKWPRLGICRSLLIQCIAMCFRWGLSILSITCFGYIAMFTCYLKHYWPVGDYDHSWWGREC